MTDITSTRRQVVTVQVYQPDFSNAPFSIDVFIESDAITLDDLKRLMVDAVNEVAGKYAQTGQFLTYQWDADNVVLTDASNLIEPVCYKHILNCRNLFKVNPDALTSLSLPLLRYHVVDTNGKIIDFFVNFIMSRSSAGKTISKYDEFY